MNIVTGDETEVGACIMGLTRGFFPANLRNHARMPHCLQWGGMASLLGGLGDRFPQPNRYLPSKSPAACCGDLYYEKYFCSKKYLKSASSARRCFWGAGYGIMQTPLSVVPLPTQQKDVSHVAPPARHRAGA